MKLRMIFKGKGDIIAILPLKMAVPEGNDAPTRFEPVLLRGQTLQDIEIPTAFANLKPHEIIERCRIQGGKLVAIKKPQKKKKK